MRSGKWAPSLRVAAKIRSDGVVVLLFGTTEPFRSVLPDRFSLATLSTPVGLTGAMKTELWLLPRKRSPDRRGCLIALQRRAAGIEVHRVFMQVLVRQHQRVLVIDRNARCLCQRSSNSIARPHALVVCASSGVLPDRCGGCPYQGPVTAGQFSDSVEKRRKCGFVLFFAIGPAVHAVVEMHNAEADTFHS